MRTPPKEFGSTVPIIHLFATSRTSDDSDRCFLSLRLKHGYKYWQSTGESQCKLLWTAHDRPSSPSRDHLWANLMQ